MGSNRETLVVVTNIKLGCVYNASGTVPSPYQCAKYKVDNIVIVTVSRTNQYFNVS